MLTFIVRRLGWAVLLAAIISLYTSISGLVKAELFPPEVRALGVREQLGIRISEQSGHR